MMLKNPIIAAIRSEEDLQEALNTPVELIFELSPSLMTVARRTEAIHAAGKRYFIHLDLAEGIGKDRCGIEYLKSVGVDGILSTRVSIIRVAREAGLFTVQRFFIVDSQSVETTIESIRASKADMMEVMPGVVPKIIRKLATSVRTPVIAGGLVETSREITEALDNGATAISTGKRRFWPRTDWLREE